MSQKEAGRPDLNRREKTGMEMILACANEMHRSGEALKPRLKMGNPKGWAFFRAALALLDKSLNLIFDTTPTRQLQQLQTMCKTGHVQLVHSAAVTPVGYTPVKVTDVNVLCAGAVNGKCAVCVEDGLSARQCPLRKSLMTIWPPKELPKYGDCPYQGVRWYEGAGDVPDGEEDM